MNNDPWRPILARPLNAKVILKVMAKNMKMMDKKNTVKYDANLKKANAKIDGLVSEINKVINKMRNM